MTKRKSTAAGVDPDDVLAELLIECRDGARRCFDFGNDPAYEEASRCQAMNAAARLMKTSVALAAALKKPPDFTHRIIVERAADPPPPKISGKTIHSDQTPQGSQD